MPADIERNKASPEAGVARTELVDVSRRSEHKLTPEISGWLEKVEKIAEVTQLGVGSQLPAHTKPSQTTSSKNKLPTSRDSFVMGFSRKIEDVGRWFSVFVLRLIKKHRGEVEWS